MVIENIDHEKCNGCGLCVKVCSCDVIRMDENKKAVIKYPEECIVCLYCEEDCPQKAIYVSPVKNFPLLTAWG
jgi:NAD-dependent dihydropyrimidine dehydrogenase PreA subunit